MLYWSDKVKYVPNEIKDSGIKQCQELGRIIQGLINSLKSYKSPIKFTIRN